eukprot:COSAG01_NODE_2358_length_7838_cov_7.568807_2_plen_651_part_00
MLWRAATWLPCRCCARGGPTRRRHHRPAGLEGAATIAPPTSRMDVLAGYLAGVGQATTETQQEEQGWLRRHTGLSRTQAASSVASLLDWVTDFRYYALVKSWTEGNYEPSADDIVACEDFLVSEGQFVNGSWGWEGDCFAAPDGFVLQDSSSSSVEGAAVTNQSCVCIGALPAGARAEALWAECRGERTVQVSGLVLDWLLVSACLGAAGDVFKACSTMWERRSAAMRERAYVRHDERHEALLTRVRSVGSVVALRGSILNPVHATDAEQDVAQQTHGANVLAEAVADADADKDDSGAEVLPGGATRVRWMEAANWLVRTVRGQGASAFPDPSEDNTTNMSSCEAFLKKLHGMCGCTCVMAEDVAQLLCTMYVELVAKPEAMVGCHAASFSLEAWLSVGAGLINGVFKLAIGFERLRVGDLNLIIGDPHRLASMREISLPGAQLTSGEAEALLDALEHRPPAPAPPPPLRVQSLNLEIMALTVNEAFCRQFAERVLRKDNLQRLRVLWMSSNMFIGDEGMVALAPALPRLRALEELAFSDTGFGDVGAVALAQALPQCENFQKVWLQRNGDIGAEGWSALAAAFAKCPKLRDLRLSHNPGIGAGGVAPIAQALPECRALQALFLNGCEIVEADAALLRAKALPTLTTLTL